MHFVNILEIQDHVIKVSTEYWWFSARLLMHWSYWVALTHPHIIYVAMPIFISRGCTHKQHILTSTPCGESAGCSWWPGTARSGPLVTITSNTTNHDPIYSKCTNTGHIKTKYKTVTFKAMGFFKVVSWPNNLMNCQYLCMYKISIIHSSIKNHRLKSVMTPSIESQIRSI